MRASRDFIVPELKMGDENCALFYSDITHAISIQFGIELDLMPGHWRFFLKLIESKEVFCCTRLR